MVCIKTFGILVGYTIDIEHEAANDREKVSCFISAEGRWSPISTDTVARWINKGFSALSFMIPDLTAFNRAFEEGPIAYQSQKDRYCKFRSPNGVDSTALHKRKTATQLRLPKSVREMKSLHIWLIAKQLLLLVRKNGRSLALRLLLTSEYARKEWRQELTMTSNNNVLGGVGKQLPLTCL